MNRDQIIDLLTLIAGFDQRTVGEGDLAAWHIVADEEHWTWPLARRAAINYHRRGGDKPRITPARVTDAILEARATIRRTVLRTDPKPPAELADDPRAEIAWRRDYFDRLTAEALAAWADDLPLPDQPAAIEAGDVAEPSEEIREFATRHAIPAARERQPRPNTPERAEHRAVALAELDRRRSALDAALSSAETTQEATP